MGKDEGPHYVLKQRGSAHALTHRAQTLLECFRFTFPPGPEWNWIQVERTSSGGQGWGCDISSQCCGRKPKVSLHSALGLHTQLMGGWQRQIVVYF